MLKNQTKAGLLARLDYMFTDREFFMRSHGQIRFLTVSAKLQKRAAIIVSSVLLLWLFITLAMTINQLTVSTERMALAEKEAAVNSSESRIAAYKDSVNDVAGDLTERQDALDQMFKQHFGASASVASELKAPDDEKAERTLSENTKKLSTAFPAAAHLAKLEARQIAFARKLTRAAMIRTATAEAAIRKYGLNPDKLAMNSTANTGGPFIPYGKGKGSELHPTLERLNMALNRMDALEQTVLGIPSAMPANVEMMTSSYGYRHDPFTGAGAMHSGIDFRGPHGEPILAAAKGVVSFAGVQSGYGNTVEISHGNGLMTRYAHMSKINVATGQTVVQGIQVGQMGSTGRSTGTHLHFEVRLNGSAINPRPFLEANSDVLKIKAFARQRIAAAPKNAGANRG